MKNLDTLSIKNLNFDDIKTSFKQYLKSQDQFTDYNLEGSNFSILFDILAYNTYYISMYQNFISSESWLDSAVQRSSVVSHAKNVGYMPRSTKSAKIAVDISIAAEEQEELTSVTIPVYSKFSGGLYFFYNINPIILTKNNNNYFVSDEPVILFEGTKISYRFISDSRNIYTIPFEFIDTDTLTVDVYNSLEFYERVKITGDYTNVLRYVLSDTLINKDGNSLIFFLQESNQNTYQIYFGDGVLGAPLLQDSIIETTFIVSNGKAANEIRSIEFSQTDDGNTSISGYSTIAITPVTSTMVSFGGQEKQDIEDIRKYAPYYYESQNRIVSLNDYEYFINQYIGNVDKIVLWGGEDNNPPRYGSVFCMIKPQNQNKLSDFQKEDLKRYIKERSVVGLDFNIVDPNVIYIIPSIKFRYSNKLTKNIQIFYNRIDAALIQFSNYSLNSFRSSDLIIFLKEQISSIKSLTVRLTLLYRTTALLNTVANYTINFDTAIVPGTLTSLQNFTLDTSGDFSERFYDNENGLVFYEKIDNVSLLSVTTQVGTVNYTTGLIQLNSIKILQMTTNINYGTDLTFWCSSVEDDFIGTHSTVPVFNYLSINKEYINDNS